MSLVAKTTILAFCIGTGCIVAQTAVGAETVPASSIPAENLLQPAKLAAILKSDSDPRPVVLQIGFRKLYNEAHIVGAEYAGPSNESAGLDVLRERVAKLPKETPIVIYCGCCPWGKCPNIGTAFSALRALGFRDVKALYIAHDFGTNWIDEGYPVTKGG